MKKLFGEINLTWTKVIIMALLAGIYTASSLLIPITRDTSFSDLGATFEVWIFFGIFIIINSKSAKESALKCFVFFLFSQPIIYLIQDIVESTSLFSTYYSVHGEFIKEGNTSFGLECPDYKKKFDLKVKQSTYDVKEKE